MRHFVTLIEICMHLIRVNPGHIWSTEHLSRLLVVWRTVGCLRVQLGNLQAFLSGQNLATCLSTSSVSR